MDQFPPSNIQISASRQFFILLGLVCFGLLFSVIVTIILVKVIPGASLDGIMNADPSLAGLARWLQVINTLLMFAVPALLFKLIVRPGRDYFRFNNKRPAILWLLAIALALAAIPAADLLTWLNEHIPISAQLKAHFKQMESRYDGQMLYMLQLNNWAGFLKSMILIALLPALFEELVFRGCLQQIMLNWIKKPFWAILVTSVIFSAVHMSYFGFLPRIFIGMLLGYVFYYGRNIGLNMIIHFINNGMIITVMFYQNLRTGSMEKALHAQTAPVLSIVGIAVLAALFYYFRQIAKRALPSPASSIL